MADVTKDKRSSTQHRSAVTTQRARSLRRNTTDVETELWNALRGRRFEGWKFRRQAPIDRFIVDFCSFEARLIVEVDGGQHNDQGVSDLARTAYLESQDFRLLRFWNNEVLGNLEGVLLTIELALKRAPGETPHPDPLPQGERGRT